MFAEYQINETLYRHAVPNALLMHCMPTIRGKKITDAMAEHANSALFRQSENRLHVQKALMIGLLGKCGFMAVTNGEASARLSALRKLLGQEKLSTQDELCEELGSLQFKVTRSTI